MLKNFSQQFRISNIYIFLFLIVLSSIVLRLHEINNLPKGLFGDEAADGLDAISILEGNRPIFLTENNGREPLHAYLISIAINVLGRTPAAIRWPSAIASILTVVGVFLASKSLTNIKSGLIAAIICSFTIWPIMLGKLATRPALLPLLLCIFIWLLSLAYKTSKNLYWSLSGLVIGVAMYSYTPIRLIILIPILISPVIFTNKSLRYQILPGFIYLFVSFILISTPLIHYTISNPSEILGRTTGVSIIATDSTIKESLNLLLNQTTTVLNMFITPNGGDWNLRHNIPKRPIFDPLMSLAFLLGLIITNLKFSINKRLFLLAWIILSLSATILSEEPPHFGRSSALISIIFVFPATGLIWIYTTIKKHSNKFIAILIPSTIMLGSIFYTIRDFYFDRYLDQPDTGFWFDEQCTIAASEINTFLGNGWTKNTNPPYNPNNITKPDKAVFISSNVCPQYSSSGYYTLQFLVPFDINQSNIVQRYTPDIIKETNTLPNQLLFLSIPGEETTIGPWLENNYTVSIIDGPWTPPDMLENSWLVYRSIYANRTGSIQ